MRTQLQNIGRYTWRNSAGYRLNYFFRGRLQNRHNGKVIIHQSQPSSFSLHPLLAGSEGTLAVIRRATVNLVPKPKHTILAVLAYQSNADACDDVPRLLTHHPSAVELVPRMIIRLARGVPEYARQMGWVIGDPAALLVVEFSGDQPSALRDAARKIGEVLTIAEFKGRSGAGLERPKSWFGVAGFPPAVRAACGVHRGLRHPCAEAGRVCA